MNRKLKAKIVEHFGTQRAFAAAIHRTDSQVSHVVRRRCELIDSEKVRWAGVLNCRVEEIFGPEPGTDERPS